MHALLPDVSSPVTTIAVIAGPPGLIEEFTRAYQEEVNRLAADASGHRIRAARQLAQVERRIGAIIAAIEQGLYTPTLKARVTALEAERSGLEAALAEGILPKPVAIHPKLAELYRRKVAELEQLLVDPELGDRGDGSSPLDDHAHHGHAAGRRRWRRS